MRLSFGTRVSCQARHAVGSEMCRVGRVAEDKRGGQVSERMSAPLVRSRVVVACLSHWWHWWQ